MRISDWSSDVCSSDLRAAGMDDSVSDETSASSSSRSTAPPTLTTAKRAASSCEKRLRYWLISFVLPMPESRRTMVWRVWRLDCMGVPVIVRLLPVGAASRSEEHTSELKSLMRISYAVFCLKKKNQ